MDIRSLNLLMSEYIPNIDNNDDPIRDIFNRFKFRSLLNEGKRIGISLIDYDLSYEI